MKIHNLLYKSYSINHLSSKLMMNTSIIRNTVAFSFSTTRKDLASHQKKSLDFLKGKNNSIRVWTLEDILEKVISKRKGISNFQYQTEFLQDISEFLKKQQSNSNTFNIVINKYFSSIQSLTPTTAKLQQTEKPINQKQLIKNLIETINSSEQWSFLPHYQNLINRQNSYDSKQLKLLIGDYNEAIIQHLPGNSYITLEQLCAMYPQKVPLSYRKRQVIEEIRQGVSRRLSEGSDKRMSLDQQPRFDEIIIINDRIKMWDQAYQVMLDELPIKIKVPYHIVEPSERFHRLNINNFISGFKQCHRIIHPEIPLQIQQQTLEQLITEFFHNLPKDAEQKGSRLQVQIMEGSLSAKRFSLLY